MPSFFCLYCGIRTDNNTTKEETTGARMMICPCCNFSIRFYILPGSHKTFTEAQQTFLDTPLTDSQKGSKKKHA